MKICYESNDRFVKKKIYYNFTFTLYIFVEIFYGRLHKINKVIQFGGNFDGSVVFFDRLADLEGCKEVIFRGRFRLYV